MNRSIAHQYAAVLQLAADLAADWAELRAEHEHLTTDLHTIRTERDMLAHQAQHDRLAIAQLTKERDEARQGWGDALKVQSPFNSRVGSQMAQLVAPNNGTHD